ncbi:MAG: VTT domain-containing protein [Peptostreptococcus sp.]|uniref:TVP38/TMEM64 family protein n=1 Tax=Peptostreptococcus sp. TaxID=1262 RepID=UPI002FC59B06
MMQSIEHILYLAQDYWILSVALGFFAAFIESFIPALPLMAIAAVNAAINGFIIGFTTSWLGSCAGTITVFYIIRKILDTEFFQRIWMQRLKDKLDVIISKVNRSEFKALFVFYAIPVLPSSLLTLASAICDIKYKVFIPPMMFGKFLMMFLVSYVGSDIKGFLHSPFKILVVVAISVLSYFIANKMKDDMETHEDEALIEYKRFKNKRIIKKQTNKLISKYHSENQLSKQYLSNEFLRLIERIIEFFKRR